MLPFLLTAALVFVPSPRLQDTPFDATPPEAPALHAPTLRRPTAPAPTSDSETPAELRIRRATTAVAEAPGRAAGYDELAMALARRARETADHAYYERALEALRVSRFLEPEGYRARKVRAWVLLGQHRFSEAREVAEALLAEVPDDLQLYAILTDATVELGDYAAAESACQWLLDMRPGNVPGLTRAAHLRELFGDPDGARDLMQQAYHSTPPREREDRAWILVQLAELDRRAGWAERAEVLAEQALTLFPGYHYALASLGHAQLALGDAEGAVASFAQRYAVAPHPENLFDLAEARAAAGQAEAAAADYARFEEGALAESGGVDNANGELVRRYLATGRTAEALRLAEREAGRRGALLTRMLHARALAATGAVGEAHAVAEAALAVGSVDPEFRGWAAEIAREAGAGARAREHARAWLAAAPLGASASAARDFLASLEGGEDEPETPSGTF